MTMTKHGFTQAKEAGRSGYDFHACICGFGEPAGRSWTDVNTHLDDCCGDSDDPRNVDPASKWVPVADLLPPENLPVLVARPLPHKTLVDEATFVPRIKPDEPWNLYEGRYLSHIHVSHWMFKPDPPPRRQLRTIRQPLRNNCR
jgi:hypothetical protein